MAVHQMDTLKDYVMGRMLWNVTLDPDAVITEFLAGYFGPVGNTHTQTDCSNADLHLAFPCVPTASQRSSQLPLLVSQLPCHCLFQLPKPSSTGRPVRPIVPGHLPRCDR